MTTDYLTEPKINQYWSFIKDAPTEVKLRLITLLSESLAEMTSRLTLKKEEDQKLKLLNEITGSWKGPESPEEIIHLIRENRSCKPPINI